MHEPDFDELRYRLIDSGVAATVVNRTVTELRDHYIDLKADIRKRGLSQRETDEIANEQLGSLDVITRHITARGELLRWSYRYPRLSRIILSIHSAAISPVEPILAGANHAVAVARWAAILTLSALVTASLFLAMQLSITLG